MLPNIQFIDPKLPHSAARSLQSMLADERFLLPYLLALALFSTALGLTAGDVVITSLAMTNVTLALFRIGFVKLCRSSPAYLPTLLAIGVTYSALLAALVVRAFSLGNEVAIALVVLAASGHIPAVTIRGAAVPALAIPNVSTLFALLTTAALAHGTDYWAVAAILICFWIGTLQQINSLHSRVRDQLLAKEYMSRAALTDALTGLANRAALDDALERQLASGVTVVALIDLDRFKAVNDTYGHDTGDELLKSVATRILDELEGHHLVVRLGGDEFAILFETGFGAANATREAERIVLALERPFVIGPNMVTIGASIGIAAAVHGDTARSLKRRADDRLYDVKRGGRGYVAHDSAIAAA
ncbi:MULTISPECIES: GGDEF domain-containing protein [Bradyrhizobium]|uniref:GGDEF domain-containing protein n=1 Tax=Bradyrhizobium TaxID=374 RepID=UPI0004038951|nr:MULTISPECIES: GGDEF domain-containing protein [Bradyrhizobium]UFW48514.1 GGDEF domain-containing protein [Bradyrhizobium arachidis]